MGDLVPCKTSDGKRDKQPISVPFIWEEKPGTPKKDWKPSPRPVKPVPLPVKLVASVPFRWEEKPGKPLPCFSQSPPLPCFSQSPPESPPAPPQTISIGFPSRPSYSNEVWSGGEEDIEDNNRDEEEIMDSEIDMCSFVTGCSSSSNGLIHEQQMSLAVTTINGGQIQIPGSPDSGTSSYATGTTSLAGATFLEWLFPLLPSRSGLNDETSHVQDVQNIDFLRETNNSLVRRPLLTLGEMIMMSRRMSYKQKANKIHKQPSMGNALGCFIFGPGNGVSRLQRKWKRQLQLKLM